jgi:hypothetical protein
MAAHAALCPAHDGPDVLVDRLRQLN